jgi:uncharacterized protein
MGCRQFRVRLHRGGIARIEVDNLAVFFDTNVLEAVSRRLKTLGFHFVTLDLEGYRSGSMNTGKPHTERNFLGAKKV